MPTVQFLSDEWLAALDAAARSRVPTDDDPLRGVSVTIDQVVVDGPRWRLVVDDGSLRVEVDPQGEADVRLTSTVETATDIAAGRRPALEAFIDGDLVLGGDARVLLAHRAALEAIGDLFAALKADTTH